MQVPLTDIPGVRTISLRVFRDERGLFCETFHAQRHADLDLPNWVQDNFSRSVRGTLRGLHYQIQQPQGKLIQVLQGTIFDVAVDLRRRSPTFGNWGCVELSEDDEAQLYLPPGLAHGFYVLSDVADVNYKCTDYYAPEHERTICWDDSDLGIKWPQADVLLSEKDRDGLQFAEAPCFDTLGD